ncbi:TetR/AcrR family transcriptional regulator [Arcanobacterium buesumense]|uniref:TetR family transcriptional regulator n=1 Tax=Arcanobacterium buesumense TaxID=2722751 RepID=A0A6H2ELH9_9ACTO|nr:TetR/AcrR family transcriptional regulator [Arcanobacterium buesumense]QJC21926.1 TetR family transcriptional regulator [Arcanobacterium buesumense]
MCECTRRETKRQETTDNIVRSAITLVTQANSIDSVSIDDIAQEAGISRRTFFNHFPTKITVLLEPLFVYRSRYIAHLLNEPLGIDAWRAIANAIEKTIDECDDLILVARSEWILTRLVHSSSAPADIPHRSAYEAHNNALRVNLQKRLNQDDPIAVELLTGIGDQILRLTLVAVRENHKRNPHEAARATVAHSYELLATNNLGL